MRRRLQARFSCVVRERKWLVSWFEETLGWPLHVDVRGGWARLSKRRRHSDSTRPARRTRGAKHPFDRRRYQLLCLCCAELSARPRTTIGILASALTTAAVATASMEPFDTSRTKERSAFVDVLKLLESWGVVGFSVGEVDSYVSNEGSKALLDVDGSRLHRLLACARAPSALTPKERNESVVDLVAREPRYGDDPAESGDSDFKRRWLRHSVARRLLDDPVLYVNDLSAGERAYLAHPSARKWLLERARVAGFHVEQRAEGLLAIDPDHIATDERFPAPNDNAKQAALLLVERFTFSEPGHARKLVDISKTDLIQHVRELLRRHKSWAKQYRTKGGELRLAEAAIAVLVQFGLARVNGEMVSALPALARYRLASPQQTGGSGE